MEETTTISPSKDLATNSIAKPSAADYARQAAKDGEGPIPKFLKKFLPGKIDPLICADEAFWLPGKSTMQNCAFWPRRRCSKQKIDHPALKACCACGGGVEVPVPHNEVNAEQRDLAQLAKANKNRKVNRKVKDITIHELLVDYDGNTPMEKTKHKTDNGFMIDEEDDLSNPSAEDYARAAFSEGDQPQTPWQSGTPGEEFANTTVCADHTEVLGRLLVPGCDTIQKSDCDRMRAHIKKLKELTKGQLPQPDFSHDAPALEGCCVCGGGERVPVPYEDLTEEQKDLQELETAARHQDQVMLAAQHKHEMKKVKSLMSIVKDATKSFESLVSPVKKDTSSSSNKRDDHYSDSQDRSDEHKWGRFANRHDEADHERVSADEEDRDQANDRPDSGWLIPQRRHRDRDERENDQDDSWDRESRRQDEEERDRGKSVRRAKIDDKTESPEAQRLYREAKRISQMPNGMDKVKKQSEIVQAAMELDRKIQASKRDTTIEKHRVTNEDLLKQVTKQFVSAYKAEEAKKEAKENAVPLPSPPPPPTPAASGRDLVEAAPKHYQGMVASEAGSAKHPVMIITVTVLVVTGCLALLAFYAMTRKNAKVSYEYDPISGGDTRKLVNSDVDSDELDDCDEIIKKDNIHNQIAPEQERSYL